MIDRQYLIDAYGEMIKTRKELIEKNYNRMEEKTINQLSTEIDLLYLLAKEIQHDNI